MTKDLTGTLPAIPDDNDYDFTDTKERGQALLDRARKSDTFAERSAKIDAYVHRKVGALEAIRKAAGFTQAQMAAELGCSQPEISKMERRETHMVNTLSRFVAAAGGRLRMIVEFDDGIVVEYDPEPAEEDTSTPV